MTVVGERFSPDDPESKRSFEMIFAPPNRFRVTEDFHGSEIVYACDSDACWMVNPEFGITEPMELPPEAALEMRISVDILGPFLGWQAEDYEVELLPPSADARERAHVVRFVHTTRFYVDYHIDPDDFRIQRYSFPHLAAGDEITQSFICQDYKEASGLILPYFMQSTYSPVAFRVDEYTINDRDFDPSMFRMPKGGRAHSSPPSATPP